LAQDLHALMDDLSGVETISVNIVTGSIVVHYDPEVINSNAILTFLIREKYIAPADAVSSQQSDEPALARVSKAVSKVLLGLALDRALQGSPLSILTVLI